jgi:hypothetical protein
LKISIARGYQFNQLLKNKNQEPVGKFLITRLITGLILNKWSTLVRLAFLMDILNVPYGKKN